MKEKTGRRGKNEERKRKNSKEEDRTEGKNSTMRKSEKISFPLPSAHKRTGNQTENLSSFGEREEGKEKRKKKENVMQQKTNGRKCDGK